MLERTLLTGISVVVIVLGLLFWFRQANVSSLLLAFVPSAPDRRVLLASISFALTFAVSRYLAFAHHHRTGPFHDIYIRGRHIHHLVWGILILLGVGYAWLLGAGESDSLGHSNTARLLALLYGAGAALTLDEFALWLNLEDVYWAREGRESIDAILVFGAFLFAGLWGRRFFVALAKTLLFRRR
jgi:hypothetical protein